MGGYKQSGGGPWGGGPWGGGPWGGGQRGGGNGQGPRGRGPQPPNIEELLRRSQEQFRRMVPGGFGSGRGFALAAIGLVALWLITGLYRVQPDELGVVLRFGQYNRTAQPGLNYHLPTPIEQVLKPKVTRVNRTEVGLRTSEGSTPVRGGDRQVPEEALMLTGDENIIDVNFTVFWVIKDAQKFLFNLRSPEATVKAVSESAMREVIGRGPITAALAGSRAQIEGDVQKLVQQVLDSYGAGVELIQPGGVVLQKVDPPEQVIDAFLDVQRARADQERSRNEAEAYRNDILPRARGEAVRLEQEAEAYKQEVVAHAQGDAERFLSVYNAYQVAPDVTTRRLYLETMEDVLRNTNKVIIDKAAESANGVVPYLPLPEIARRPGATPRGQQPSAGQQPQAPPPPAQQRGAGR